ncbi:hypothetical protein Scep_027784 [Stephania cephalantha]|uniref:Uncharacterized protein n=1 Tax=Stephania cephalantha TaxID=152367 RepID=A0AAP0EBZ1_9MAGN
MVGGGKGRSSREEKGNTRLVKKPKQISKAPPKPIMLMGISMNNLRTRAPREPSPPLSFEYDLEGEEEIEETPTIPFHTHSHINVKVIAKIENNIIKNRKIIPERGFNIKKGS